MMGTEIFKIDASWAEKLTKTRVQFLMTPTVLQEEFQLPGPATHQMVRINLYCSLESCKVNKLSVIYFAGPIECRAITSLCAAIKYYRTETLCWSTSWGRRECISFILSRVNTQQK